VVRQNASDVADDQTLSITAAADGYWLNDLSGKGYAAFNSNPGAYKVFRNVKDYGARGERYSHNLLGRASLTGNR
jgi:glucan 1,3-beta-glucosidase